MIFKYNGTPRFVSIGLLIVAGCAVSALPARRCDGALAALTGGSGYSGTLSSNRAIRKQQLICDPTDASKGSTSTNYDPTIVSIDSVYNEDGYFIDSAHSYVGVSTATSFLHAQAPLTRATGAANAAASPPPNQQLVTLDEFFNPQPTTVYIQSGYLQITWTHPGDIGEGYQVFGTAPDFTGYNLQQHDGVTGTNTHGMIFAYGAVPDDTVATYTNYAAPGGIPIADGGTSLPDALYDVDGTFVPGPYITATVSAPLPEPAGLALIALPALAVLARRRRQAPIL